MKGTIEIAGAKNAALPIMAASLLTSGEMKFHNIPHVADVTTMANLLGNLGAEISINKRLIIKAENIQNLTAPYSLVSKMRASILVLGPLLAKYGEAKVSLPGGCAIGTRPVDMHLDALEEMGAEIEIEKGYIVAKVKGKLQGAKIKFKKPSVGATENIMMAATLAEGRTILKHCAREPEIVDLANCLNAMGAEIEGAGTDTIKIEGVEKLHGAEYSIMPDRIEAGTYAIATAMTNGNVILKGVSMELLEPIIPALKNADILMEEVGENEIRIRRANGEIKPIKIKTEPYPGFPTDMQAQVMVLMTIANGTSVVKETIFENRFMHAPELKRMGADITIDDNVARVEGVEKLYGTNIMATDLRASVCLIMAGLVAEGTTIMDRVYHLDRGYERLFEKLIKCGADLRMEYS